MSPFAHLPKYKLALVITSLCCLNSNLVLSHEAEITGKLKPLHANSHAPIGVTGDHRHQQGEWMISYRYMDMEMDGNILGDDSITPEEIVTHIANPFAGPQTLRVVPTRMTTAMHMLGLMYAPSDTVTVMGMMSYVNKEMDHLTFAGMSGTRRLGVFSTENAGLGDSKLSALVKFINENDHQIHFNIGLSLPTGSIDKNDTVLTPMGTNQNVRMPYAMQLGSGTYDLEAGATYNGKTDAWSWGAQYLGLFRLGENGQDYTLGDVHKLSVWGGYEFINWLSTSARLAYKYEQDVDGRDDKVSAPVSTANPDNYGGEVVNLALGINLIGQAGAIRGHRVALEYQVPLYQDVNGLQLEMDSMFTIGYQYAF